MKCKSPTERESDSAPARERVGGGGEKRVSYHYQRETETQAGLLSALSEGVVDISSFLISDVTLEFRITIDHYSRETEQILCHKYRKAD